MKYDGTLELSAFHRDSSADKTRGSPSTPDREDTAKLITNAAQQHTENVIYEQQQSMYR